MKFIKTYWKNLLIIVLMFLLVFVVKRCESEPIIKTETKVVYKDRIDTIQKTIIKEVPKKVYYEVVKTVKGKDSIVYVDKPSNNSNEALVFDVKIVSDSSSADLKITSRTKPIDVKGVIKCKEKETTIKEMVIKPKSGLFIYAQSSFNPLFENVGIGLDYQIRNTIILGLSVNYDNISQKTYTNAKIGFRIF